LGLCSRIASRPLFFGNRHAQPRVHLRRQQFGRRIYRKCATEWRSAFTHGRRRGERAGAEACKRRLRAGFGRGGDGVTAFASDNADVFAVRRCAVSAWDSGRADGCASKQSLCVTRNARVGRSDDNPQT
jgi:hypothetical protein